MGCWWCEIAVHGVLVVRGRRSWGVGGARQPFMGCWWCEVDVHGVLVVRGRRPWGVGGAR
jgi:hypothetical protein